MQTYRDQSVVIRRHEAGDHMDESVIRILSAMEQDEVRIEKSGWKAGDGCLAIGVQYLDDVVNALAVVQAHVHKLRAEEVSVAVDAAERQ